MTFLEFFIDKLVSLRLNYDLDGIHSSHIFGEIMSNSELKEERQLVDTSMVYRRSNIMINSKSRSSLLCQKVLATAIMYAKKTDSGNLESRVHTSVLRELMNNKNGSLYDQLVQVASPQSKHSLLNWVVGYQVPGQEFQFSNVITDISYKNGELSVIFNKKMIPYLVDLKSNYTNLPHRLMMRFDSYYTYRIYELCKSEIDYQRAVTKRPGPYVKDYNLVELKMDLGIIDSTSPEIAKLLRSENPDYDGIREKIEQKLEEESRTKSKKKNAEKIDNMVQYGDFRRYALEKAKTELATEGKSDIFFDYEPIRSGRGGKVIGVRFIMDMKNAVSVEKPVKSEFELIDDLQKIIPGITVVDAKTLLDAAGGDIEKVKSAYLVAQQTSDIDNFTGWMVAAIKKGYKPNASYEHKGKVTRRSKKTNPFNDFEQHDYDFDAIEAMILANQKAEE